MDKLKKFGRIYNQIEEKVISWSFLILVALIFLQVIYRYVLHDAITWSEELCRYIYVWECWLGVSLVQHEGRHLQLTFLVEKMGPKKKKITKICVDLVCFITAIMLIYYGLQMALLTASLGTSSPAMGIPVVVYYLCMPIGCALYVIRIIIEIITLITDKKGVACNG
ncbi:MAG: TRAP transporter small permease [Firmicutes bacterium]|jgi:TRAP-type C4-dicarboxylate transport system permease small subunit|nr:TRAP transporter small permease [Bacillota bacterium]